ncbi:MAG: MoaD/ThiS family protein [Candidatus Heimdallarchaeota archaeon]|nr:MoaD/ThiS family protein [Candidatus Heimdallarchaeota archaeon]MCK4972299.1 MoaD/ThiS family protein [Candidatus Heimdallarchaeota archaeon]
MIVNIHCFGQIRTLTKEKIVEMNIRDNATIPYVLDEFVKKYGETMEKLLYNEGKIRDFYTIQVDKKHVKNEEFEDYNLQDGETIAIIPFIAGG